MKELALGQTSTLLHSMQAILAISREAFGMLGVGLARSLLCTRKLSPFPAELRAVRMAYSQASHTILRSYH